MPSAVLLVVVLGSALSSEEELFVEGDASVVVVLLELFEEPMAVELAMVLLLVVVRLQ